MRVTVIANDPDNLFYLLDAGLSIAACCCGGFKDVK